MRGRVIGAIVALVLAGACETKRVREWRPSDHDQPEDEGQVPAAEPGSAEDPGDVATEMMFRSQCAPCHGADGSGRTPMAAQMPVRDLRASTLTEDEIVQVVTRGRARMPAFGQSLDPDAIRALAKAVLSMRPER